MGRDERKWCKSPDRKHGPKVYRDALDTPTHDYQRVGLYYVTKGQKERNFCDIHVDWSYAAADRAFMHNQKG